MRRQLSHYSSSSSASSPEIHSAELLNDGPPPCTTPLFFRRNSSMESVNRGYESPDQEEEMEEEVENMEGSSGQVESAIGGNGSVSLAAAGCLRTPRGGLSGVPRTIVEDDDLSAAILAPIYADLAIARTRSMPLPRHEVSMHNSVSPVAASASSVDPSSSSLLPGAQPGFGSAHSWGPGFAPPMPYTFITPVHAPQDDEQEASLDDLPPPSFLSFAPLPPLSPLLGSHAESDDLPPLFSAHGHSPDASFLHAPPPSRAPSLVRQTGVYKMETSRSFSAPIDLSTRLHNQQRMAREVQEREEQFHRDAALQQQQLQQPPTPTITRYIRRRD